LVANYSLTTSNMLPCKVAGFKLGGMGSIPAVSEWFTRW